MKTLITMAIIEKEYRLALEEAFEILDPSKWVIQPDTQIALTSHKTSYGLAFQTGQIEVNKVFIGSTAINKLRSTLRHELAHLCVGLKQNHNKYFHHFAHLFGMNNYDTTQDEELIGQLIKFKYTVYATLENGEKVEIGGMHRKTKKYSNYRRSPSSHLLYNDQVIEYFTYKLN